MAVGPKWNAVTTGIQSCTGKVLQAHDFSGIYDLRQVA